MKQPYPDNLPGTEIFITVEQQAKAIRAALDAASASWIDHPSKADYSITIKIMGVEYPLFINAIDVVEQIYTAVDEIISIAAENQW